MELSGAPYNRDYAVVIVGEYYFDLIFRGLPHLPRIGADVWAKEFDWVPGAAFYTALAFARLGTRAGWWCDFGNDLFSRMILEEARRESIDNGLFIHLDRPLRRVSTAFSFDHDRGFISYSELPEILPTPDDLRRINPRFLLLQGFPTSARKRALAAAARQQGITVCSDCQHFDAKLSNAEVEEALGLIDIFLPNATEALSLTGASNVEEALDILSGTCPTVVVKRGRDGASAVHRGMRYHVGALDVEVVDTTGAGDSFNAGFVHGLVNREDFESALEAGVICGSLAVTDFGGRRLPFRDDLERYRRQRPAAPKHSAHHR